MLLAALTAALAASALAAAAAAAAATASSLPRVCHWTEWHPAPSQTCHWQNKTVGVVIKHRQENRFVTYCSQVTRVRQRRCEGQTNGQQQFDYEYKEPTAFQIDSSHPDGEPLPVRSPDDKCPYEKCPPLDGQWCYWTMSVGCELRCRQAAQNGTEVYFEKSRMCSCPKPRNGGRKCDGPDTLRERCHCVSLSASFMSFLRTTEGVLIACGLAAIVLLLLTCCIARVCCDTDDGTEDFKISELPQALQRRQHQEPLLLNLDAPAPVGLAETELGCPLDGCQGPAAAVRGGGSGGTTSSTGTAASAASSSASQVVRLPSKEGARVPPPLPPKRYKEKQQQQQQQQDLRSRRQMSFDREPPLKYTPPFPNEI